MNGTMAVKAAQISGHARRGRTETKVVGQTALDHLFCSDRGSIRGKFGLGVWDQGMRREERDRGREGKNLDLAGRVHDLNQQEESEFARGGDLKLDRRTYELHFYLSLLGIEKVGGSISILYS